MNINALPDLVLRTIFSNLPLRDLLRIDLVCPTWKTLQPAVCSTVKKVVILVGDDAINLLNEPKFRVPHLEDLEGAAPKPELKADDWNTIDFDWLDKATTAFLTALLPNIADAQIAIRGIQPTNCIGEKSWGIKSVALEQLITLLTTWSLSLRSLKLCTSFTDYYQQEYLERDMPKLLLCFNTLEALRHLTLELQNSFFYEAPKVPLDMPFLAHLETFYLDFMDQNDLVFESLRKYAKPNAALREIGFGNIYDSDLSNEFFTNPASLDFYRKFTQFPSLEFSEATEGMRLFCERFSSLQKVSLSIHNLPMIYKMTRHLRALRELLYLDMNINFDEEHGIAWDAEQELEMVRSPPVLPSVKILNLYAPLQRHTDLYEIQWNVMFPNLEVLHYHDGWSDCQICMPRDEAEDANEQDEAAAANEAANAAAGNNDPVRIQLILPPDDQNGGGGNDRYLVIVENANEPELELDNAVFMDANEYQNEEDGEAEEAELDDDEVVALEQAEPMDVVDDAANAVVLAPNEVIPENNIPVIDLDEVEVDDAPDNETDQDVPDLNLNQVQHDLNEVEMEVLPVDAQNDANESDNQHEDGNLNLALLFGDDTEHGHEEHEDGDGETEETPDREEETRQKCQRLCVQPWRHCLRLRKVFIGDTEDPKEWKLEDLWSEM